MKLDISNFNIDIVEVFTMYVLGQEQTDCRSAPLLLIQSNFTHTPLAPSFWNASYGICRLPLRFAAMVGFKISGTVTVIDGTCGTIRTKIFMCKNLQSVSKVVGFSQEQDKLSWPVSDSMNQRHVLRCSAWGQDFSIGCLSLRTGEIRLAGLYDS